MKRVTIKNDGESSIGTQIITEDGYDLGNFVTEIKFDPMNASTLNTVSLNFACCNFYVVSLVRKVTFGKEEESLVQSISRFLSDVEKVLTIEDDEYALIKSIQELINDK